MNATETTNELLTFVYKNVKMGSDSISYLMPKVNDIDLTNTMKTHLEGYEKFATRAKSMLNISGEEAKEENVLTKASAKMGMTMNTLVHSSSSHIAEMLIQGSTMGIVDMTKKVREFENKPCSEGSLSLAKEVISFEENKLEEMKKFL
jgi:hypothetical protein